jgi:RNA polymerase sigma factor (sigma-70 family)
MRVLIRTLEGTEGHYGCELKSGRGELPNQRRAHVPKIDYPIEGATVHGGSFPYLNRGRKSMSSADTRGSVIEGVCRQDPERWREFDTIYRPILFAFLRKQGLKEVEADEVVQETFVKLLTKIQSYDRAKCRFRTWLFRVTYNALVDRARRKATRQKALEGWAATMLHSTPSDSMRMEEEFGKLHLKKILALALKEVRKDVSPVAWACFEQRLLQNRPAAKIAEELGISPNSVYVNSCRVMKLVRDFCAALDEDISHGFDSEVSE